MPTKPPIKIAFVVPKAYPLFNPEVEAVFGGAEVDVYFLATELAKDSAFEVSCLVADYGQSAVETRESVELIRTLDFGQNAIVGAKKIWDGLRQVNADIYFMKTASPGVPLVAAFCKRHGKHFVYRTAHSRECDGTWFREHPLLGQAFKWSLQSARFVFAQNQSDAQQLQQTLGISSCVIPNGHRIPALAPAPGETILWVARSAAFKRPMKFLDLAQAFPDEPFTMICPQATDDRLHDQVRQRAISLPNVEFIHHVPFHQMDRYFQNAKLFVNTSDAEGFPNTFIQAARTATPILSLNVNPDNFLNHHHCGQAAQNNWTTFIQMCQNLQNPNLANTYGQNGRNYVKQHHDIDTIVEKYKVKFHGF